jgi:SNF2 family DNA or RNA helicase
MQNAKCGLGAALATSCNSLDLSLQVESLPVDFASVFAVWPALEITTLPPLSTDAAPPTISLRIPKASPRTFSFAFDTPAAASNRFQQPPSPPPISPSPPRPPAPSAQTRIAPPGDVIKLEDRLYYLLQPPLESLLTSDALHFPFEPFSYQFQGVAFLYPRYSAILADEMGLGKTMQAITAIRMLLRSGEVRSVLLICPKPLVTNWRREFGMWAPEIPLTIVEGDAAKRQWQWAQEDAPVKIANYELLMRDRDVLDDGLAFDLVVLDEAQRIKNTGSTTSQVVRSIRRTRNWALTGTPIENTPDDLVGIFEFLSPGYLRPGTAPRRLGELVRDHILRRTKDMVLTDLPPKMFRDAELDLSPEQRATYEMAENEGVMRLNLLGGEITIQHVFELVLRLKQICNFDPATGASSKLERLEADLEEVAASGKKAIVFSQWVKCLEILSHQLRRFGPLEYHGQIPSKQRDSVLAQFKEDKSKHIILMSYGAGSVGLNLQFCEYVFLFDRWWNPAVEDQAINRAHRIGAAGPVTVTRMLSLATIEERINQILEHKRDLFAQIIGENTAPASMGLSQAEIFSLFNLRTPQGVIHPVAA